MAFNVFETPGIFLSEVTSNETNYTQSRALQQHFSKKVIEKKYQLEIFWRNMITFAYTHIAGLHNWGTFIFTKITSNNMDTNVQSTTSNDNNIKLKSVDDDGKIKKYKNEIIWKNVIFLLYIHISGVYSLYLCFFESKWITFIYAFTFSFLTTQGITSGVHRLWTHRTYKAKLPLRIFLMILQTMQMQTNIYEWARDHRVHHKYTDTDADPHNSTRGFFFSHVGWLLVKKHKEVIIKGKTIDLSDVLADPVVRFQKKYYYYMIPIISIAFPMWVPIYFFGEDLWMSYHVLVIMRYVLSLNFTWLVNSAAHIYGTRPYDKTIRPTQNIWVSMATSGEGWHNYHHVYPWDYKADELPNYPLNWSTLFIDTFAKIGWAYDLKTVSPEIIKRRLQRTGDSSKAVTKKYDSNAGSDKHHDEEIWGWGDTDMNEDDIKSAKVYNALIEN